MVLEYRRAKPMKRKSRSSYNDVQLFNETSLSDVYYAQCYKLFTAVKIPSDFKSESATGCKNEGGKLEMVWFSGNQLPEAYEDVVVSPEIFGNTSDSDTQDGEENDQCDLNVNYESDSTDDKD